MNAHNDVPEVKKDFTKKEAVLGIIVFLIIGLVGWQMFTSEPKPDYVQAPAVTPASAQDIVVTSQIVKAVDGKYRYFFDIRNQDDVPFSGDVNIELDKPSGEHIYDKSFSSTQPIQPGLGTSLYVEAHTGPVSVHGPDGAQTFKYTISNGGSVVNTGQGTISTKLESY